MKNIGVFLARMQPVHNAHLYMVKLALEECDEVVIILGSENKRDMIRNPFNIRVRERLLKNALPPNDRDRIKIYEIPDWSMESKREDDKTWGRYLYYNIVSRIGQKHFKFFYSDGIENLNAWFGGTEVEQYIEYKVYEREDMFDGLSATKIRDAFVRNDREYIKKYCPDSVYQRFELMRAYYMSVLQDPEEDFEME